MSEQHPEWFGIIPAYAGSTTGGCALCRAARDHPRIRGEHGIPNTNTASDVGSSPHTRGAPSISRERESCLRIIPAYAGSTRRRRPRGAELGDHPRIRGEHYEENSIHDCSMGSSPHTRGARSACRPEVVQGGIIPAYAGSTSGSLTCSARPWDHPRIRGEHYDENSIHDCSMGSSPHTRGAPVMCRPSGRLSGIIPAYAGSTPCCVRSPVPSGDHPRIRGEHRRVSMNCKSEGGSSPHTRGAREDAV